jgi:quercetin dioxygenase-like cupin family protein
MIPPHTHTREDECSFVLEGEMMCYVAGEVVLAQKGSYVIKPRGVPHTFYNTGAETVRVMEILTRAARSKVTSTSTRRSSHGRRVTRSAVGHGPSSASATE